MKRFALSLLLAMICSATVWGQRYVSEELQFQAPSVPQYIVFAGDTVRFNRSDLYERMDRELITFTYSHINSILMLKRSDRYFPQIEPILKLYGIPDDLKYLMAIESNLSPKALSTAGAAGLWQFTKATAKEYGLIVDAEVDERYNIEKETVAACQYLNKAYSKYGDWMTVAASYNAGQGGISKRLADQHQKSAMDLLLVEETSRYMFRILVAKMFFEKPEAFGFKVDKFAKYPYYSPKDIVTVNGPIESLVDFAEQHGCSYMQLKEANLWLRGTKLENKSGHSYKVLIPNDK
ncbi:MAG: lytic transglycosylase domain-containing protein [Bacteroidales bacterium]|nr:lytic transglycosylase domain-containing protein [Bacteroidales bacterium]